MTPQPIEFYFDFVSPFGYLGSVRIERLAELRSLTVDWKPVLIGITILKVMGLKPLPETPLKGPYLKHDIERMARMFDIPYRPHGLSGVNSLAASRAFLWLKARDPDLAAAFARRIYRRLWVEGKDITPPDAAAEEAAALGVDGSALLAALAEPEVKQSLNKAVEEAIGKGVFGVPTFIADGEPFWGSDRIWMLEHWLDHGNWDPPE